MRTGPFLPGKGGAKKTRDGYFRRDTQSPLSEVAEIEQRIDDITRKFRQNQIDRMREGNCNVESSILYSEMLTDYERIGDHMLNIAQAYDAIEWSGDRGQTAAAIA